MQQISDDVATRRGDPKYVQVSGYIPKELALRFKVACTALEKNRSEGLEEAIEIWLKHSDPLKKMSDTHDEDG